MRYAQLQSYRGTELRGAQLSFRNRSFRHCAKRTALAVGHHIQVPAIDKHTVAAQAGEFFEDAERDESVHGLGRCWKGHVVMVAEVPHRHGERSEGSLRLKMDPSLRSG